MKKSEWKKIGFGDKMGWLVGVVGIVATLISAFRTETNGFVYIFIGLLVAEVIAVFAWLWALHERYRMTQKVDEIQSEIKKLKDENTKLQNDLKKSQTDEEAKLNEVRKKIEDICVNQKNVSKLYNEFCTRIPNIAERSYHILETLQKGGMKDTEELQKEVVYSFNEFAAGLYDVYKIYSSNLLNYLVRIEESYLASKGIQVDVAATIKLFDKPYVAKKDSRDKIVVYTAFRDKETFEKHEREVGNKKYTIDGNGDFVHCLKKDHFVVNNAKKNSENYMNEHIDFDAYYNCAIVVSIRTKLADGTYKYFGYLCCDCKNAQEGLEVFDKPAAQLLFSLAQQYATFLSTLDSNWVDRTAGGIGGLPQGFLQLIYAKAFTGNFVS